MISRDPITLDKLIDIVKNDFDDFKNILNHDYD